MEQKRKVGILARVSTDEAAQREEGSIKNQVAGCRSYVESEIARTNGTWGHIVDEYIDDGYSGKDLNRPEIKRLLEDTQKKRINCVVMTEISRLSRNKRDWLDLLDYFQKNEIQFITLRQKFDLTSAMGRMTLSLMIEFSQLEREQCIERVTASIHERKKRGLYNGGPIPFGLEKTEKKGHLKVSPTRQVIANSILDTLLNEGGSLKPTCRIINSKGWVRDCGEHWNFQALSHWINNPHVAGEVEINAKNKNKNQTVLKDSEKYRVVKAVWDPVVDLTKLKQARLLLKDNFERLNVGQWKHHDYILSDLLYCKHGNKLNGRSGHGRSGKKYAYYKHSYRIKCDCGLSNVPAVEIEQHVLRELKRLFQSPQLVSKLCVEGNEKFKTAQPDYAELVRQERVRFSGVIRQIDRITDEILSVEDSDQKTMWREKAYRLHQEKAAIEKQIAHLENQKLNRPQLLDAEAITKALSQLADGIGALPKAARLRLLRAVVERVTIEDQNLKLRIKGPELFGSVKESEEVFIRGTNVCPHDKNGSGVQFLHQVKINYKDKRE